MQAFILYCSSESCLCKSASNGLKTKLARVGKLEHNEALPGGDGCTQAFALCCSCEICL